MLEFLDTCSKQFLKYKEVEEIEEACLTSDRPKPNKSVESQALQPLIKLV